MYCYFQFWLLFKGTVFPVLLHSNVGFVLIIESPLTLARRFKRYMLCNFVSATINRPIPIELRNWTVISEFNFWWKGTWKSLFGLKKGTRKINRQKKVISRVMNTTHIRSSNNNGLVLSSLLWCCVCNARVDCSTGILYFLPLICDVLEVILLRLLHFSFSLIVKCIQMNTIINILECSFPLDFWPFSKDTLSRSLCVSAPLNVINLNNIPVKCGATETETHTHSFDERETKKNGAHNLFNFVPK